MLDKSISMPTFLCGPDHVTIPVSEWAEDGTP
jgi:hypothetical protein